MISFIDAFTLSTAKIHSKRVMLAIAILVSGLLFGVLYGGIMVFNGISKSASEYTKATQDGKYLVKSTPNIPSSVFGPDNGSISADLINELNSMQSEYVTNQKNLANKFGVAFDESSLEKIIIPNPYASQNLPESQRVMVNRSSPIYQDYLQKLQSDYAATAVNKLSDLKQLAVKYGAVEYHINKSAAVSFTNLSFLKDDKEDLSDIGQYINPVNSDLSGYGYTTSSVQNSMYSFMDNSLINRFILPTNDKRQASTVAIPVIITSKEAVDIFGKQLGISTDNPNNDTAGQIAWMQNLQQKINGLIYKACYRNNTEISELAQIIQVDKDIEANKNNPSYVMPSLIYNLPTTSCGPVTIKSDTRTPIEKEAANRKTEIEKQQGVYVAPEHYLFSFQIVGIMPVAPTQNLTTSLPMFMSNLLGAQYGSGAIIPMQMYEKLPNDIRQEDILLNSQLSSFNSSAFDKAGIVETIVEFTSLNDARSFIKYEGCPPSDNKCQKLFFLESFGSNYLLVDDLNAAITNILQVIFPVTLIIAGIIMGVTMARVIIDSRRETAIFRAIGARRIDIITVYLIYSVKIAIRIIVFSLTLGLMMAGLVQALFSTQVTNYAKVTYGIFDNNRIFNFIDLSVAPLVLLAVCIVIVSLLAISPSLIRNVRRNPIKDMRDE